MVDGPSRSEPLARSTKRVKPPGNTSQSTVLLAYQEHLCTEFINRELQLSSIQGQDTPLKLLRARNHMGMGTEWRPTKHKEVSLKSTESMTLAYYYRETDAWIEPQPCHPLRTELQTRHLSKKTIVLYWLSIKKHTEHVLITELHCILQTSIEQSTFLKNQSRLPE